MIGYRVIHVEPDQVGRYAEQLRDLERSITYPLADGAEQFYIDHGRDYARFFTALGEAGFLFAFDGQQLVGTFAAAFRRAEIDGAMARSLYIADYKVRESHRGRGVSTAIVWAGVASFRHPVMRSAKIYYAAAMRGARGDVMRTARRSKRVMFLARPIARMHVYFADPERLARLDLSHAPGPPPGRGLDLSPDAGALARGPGIASTAGRKDLRIVSSGEPFPLEHLPLGPARQAGGFGAYLRACGEGLAGSRASACFAIDDRLDERVRWLRGQGVEPGARCTVYSMRLPPTHGAIDWVHLATSEI